MFEINVNVVKNAAEITGNICGGLVTGTVLGAIAPANANAFIKGAYVIGSGLIGAIVGDACGKEASKQAGMIFGEN